MALDPSSSTPIPRYMVPSDGRPGELDLDTGQIKNGTMNDSPLIISLLLFRYKGETAGFPLLFQMLEPEFPAIGGTAGLAGAAGHSAEGTQVVGKAKTWAQHAVAMMVSNNIKCDNLPLCTTTPNVSHSQVVQSTCMAAGLPPPSCLTLVDKPYL
jgi:hypothetical protein